MNGVNVEMRECNGKLIEFSFGRSFGYPYMSDSLILLIQVMIWNHLLKGAPVFCDNTVYTSSPEPISTVVLATHETRELVSFNVRPSADQIHPVSLSPPLSLSSATDWATSLKLHCVDVEDDVMQRLSSPLKGVCTVPHQKDGFTVFQLTHYGDLFYQDLKRRSGDMMEKTYLPGPGCVVCPPEKIIPLMEEWTKTLKKKKSESSAFALDRIDSDLSGILDVQNKVSDSCPLCKSFNTSDGKECFLSDFCPCCGLGESDCERLLKASKEAGFLCGVSDSLDLSMFDATDMTQWSDAYSKKLMAAWLTADDAAIQSIKQESDSDNDLPHSASHAFATSTPFKPPSQSSSLGMFSQQDALSMFASASFTDEALREHAFDSQDSLGVVPPSQEEMPTLGRTLRTPRVATKRPVKKNTPSAGF